jgi:uncharacterized membrane protein YoaK (UPF0700 family)
VNVNPTLRGFGIIVLVAAVITALQLQVGLEVILLFLNILFLLAIAYVLFLLWRSRREEISMWSTRSRVVFYAAAALAIANIVLWFATDWPETGLQTLVFFFVLFAAGFAMWRVWREEHTYGY